MGGGAVLVSRARLAVSYQPSALSQTEGGLLLRRVQLYGGVLRRRTLVVRRSALLRDVLRDGEEVRHVDGEAVESP